MGHKTGNARKGARALKRYRKQKRCRELLCERPDIVLYMAGISVAAGWSVTETVGSVMLGILVSAICMFLCFGWLQGKIL